MGVVSGGLKRVGRRVASASSYIDSNERRIGRVELPVATLTKPGILFA